MKDMNRKPFSSEFKIEKHMVGHQHPTYFIADVAANHDGDLSRAKDLIYLAAEAGADAAKFQHFKAKTIVSDYGFKNLGGKQSHQASWSKSVFDVYNDASLNMDWTPALKETCEKAGIGFFTSPYAFDLVDAVDPYVSAYKVGSGDITWHEIVEKMATKKKPVIVATGASTSDEVYEIVNKLSQYTGDIAILQCNTNYTAEIENFKYINLNVLNTYRSMFPGAILGLSDHTLGHATVLGAVALGARVIEKHFTDSTTRVGPDHKFSMDPRSWKEMVQATRELEAAMGTGVKKVEDNERETVVLQRRAVRFKADVPSGTILSEDHFEVLRPCPTDGLSPYRLKEVIGKKLRVSAVAGEHVRMEMI